MAVAMNRLRRASREEHGQSLVEVALLLPILLLIVIGIVDITRLYAFKSAATNAAREAAIYAARDPQATADRVCQRARDELGAGGPPALSTACGAADIAVDCTRATVPCGSDASLPGPLFQTAGASGGDVTVRVTYRVELITGYLVMRVFAANPVTVTGTAFFPGLGE